MLWTDIQLSAWNLEEQQFHILDFMALKLASLDAEHFYSFHKIKKREANWFQKMKVNKCRMTSALQACLLCGQCWPLKIALNSLLLALVTACTDQHAGAMLHFHSFFLNSCPPGNLFNPTEWALQCAFHFQYNGCKVVMDI